MASHYMPDSESDGEGKLVCYLRGCQLELAAVLFPLNTNYDVQSVVQFYGTVGESV